MRRDIYINYKTGPEILAHIRITYNTPSGTCYNATSKLTKANIILEDINYGYFE